MDAGALDSDGLGPQSWLQLHLWDCRQVTQSTFKPQFPPLSKGGTYLMEWRKDSMG